MGMFTSRKTSQYLARYVVFQLNGQPVNIDFVADGSLAPGVLAVTEVASRFAGSKLTLTLKGPRLLVTGHMPKQPITSPRTVVAKNTGDAIVHGSGMANSGVVIRGDRTHQGPATLDLGSLDYQIYNADGPLTLQSVGGKARLTIAVGKAGTNYAII